MTEPNRFLTPDVSNHPTPSAGTWSTPESPLPSRNSRVAGHLPQARDLPLRPQSKGYARYKKFLDDTFLETSRIFHRRLLAEAEEREKAEKERREKEEAERRRIREEARQARLAKKKEREDKMDVDGDGDSDDTGESEDEEEFEDVINVQSAPTQSPRREEKKSPLASKKALDVILKNLEQCVDLLHISNTPAIQIPYLLTLTSDLNDYLSGYHPNLPPTLRLFDKIDQCFHTLLQKNEMSVTDKVRLKSIVERVQLHIVNLADLWEEEGGVEEEDRLAQEARQKHELEKNGAEGARDGQGDEKMGEEKELEEDEIDEEEVEWDVEAARVFWRTFKDVGEGLKDGLDNASKWRPPVINRDEACVGGFDMDL